MTGLNVGNYHPDHSGYAQQLQEQIASKTAAKQKDLQRERDFDLQQAGRLQSAPQTSHKSLEQQNKLRYRQDLDEQVKAARNSQQAPGDLGVSLQFEQDRVFEKEAYRRDLDQQVQSKNRQKEEGLHRSRQQEAEYLRRISSATEPQIRTEEKNSRSTYKQQLDLQNELNNARRQELELKEKIEILNSTGLPLGKYNPNHKEYLKTELTKQICEKETQKQLLLADKQAQDAEYLEKVRAHVLANQPEYNYAPAPQLTYKEQLDLQNASLQDLKKAQQERDLQEERNITGLPLGKYHPDHRDELRKGLQQQMEEKKQQLGQQEEERIRREKHLLEQAASVKPLDPLQLHREAEASYRGELYQQAQANRALSKERALRELQEERAVTGLPLGKYHPDHRDELRSALDSQVREKRDRLEELQRVKREQESEHLRLLNSVRQPDAGQASREVQESYKSQLDEQNRGLEEIKKLQSEVERLEMLNNTGLKIGDYKPYDREALKRELEAQMEQKRALRDSERRNQKSVERLQLEQIDRLLEQHRASGHLTSDELNLHKAGLIEQIRRNSAARNSDRERDRLEARSSTGLPLGLYNPDHREELKHALETQIEEKKVRAERERSQSKELDRTILDGIAKALEAGRNSVTTDRFGREFLSDLESQAAEERRRKQEERDFRRLGDSGLGVGDYKGYDKQELVRALQSQIEEKQQLRTASKVAARDQNQRREEEIEHLRKIQAALQSSTDPGEIDRILKQDYRGQLDEQTETRRRDRQHLSKRQLEEERLATGLKVGQYNPDFREELKTALLKQMGENEQKRSEARERDLAEEKSILRQIRQAEQPPEQQAAADQYLKAQAKRRDLEELAKSVGLDIGHYQGYEKQEFRAYLDRQIGEKENQAKQDKVAFGDRRAASCGPSWRSSRL